MSPVEPLEAALDRIGWMGGEVDDDAECEGSIYGRPEEIFALMDIKGDGVLDVQELKIGLTRLRKGWVDDEELAHVVATYDSSAQCASLTAVDFADFLRGDPALRRRKPRAAARGNNEDELEHDLTQEQEEEKVQEDQDMTTLLSNELEGDDASAAAHQQPSRKIGGRAAARGSGRRSSRGRGGSNGVGRRADARSAPNAAAGGDIGGGGAEAAQSDFVAHGVRRDKWTSLVASFGGGSSGNGGGSSTSFPPERLAEVLAACGCGLRCGDTHFLQLLALKLDPAHVGAVRFQDLLVWLRHAMALVGAVEQSTTATATTSGEGGAGAGGEEGATGATDGDRATSLRAQIDALSGALSVSVPSIDHPSIDSAIVKVR